MGRAPSNRRARSKERQISAVHGPEQRRVTDNSRVIPSAVDGADWETQIEITSRTASRRSVLWALASLSVACELPRDPRRSLERARHGKLRVAVSEHAPWVSQRGPEPAGIEPDRVRRFAIDIGARVVWSWAMVDEALAALEAYELDIVLGGLTPRSPWKRRVALTLPYHVERVVVGVPAPAPAPTSLDGVEVGCELGSLSALWLRERRALPVPFEAALASGLPVAAGHWKIRRLGLRATEHVLGENERVMAVAPGENALLTALERSLVRGRGEIEAALDREPST